MADVCIIYSHLDRDMPPRLAALLSPRWSVWWDDSVRGDFRLVIESEISAAKCVIPIWSSNSRNSDIVFDEATLAKKMQIPLLPVAIEKDLRPPLGFGAINVIDLSGWDGKADHAGIRRLLKNLNEIVPAPVGDGQRPRKMEIGALKVPTPVFFFSVSSYETQLKPVDAVRALTLFGAEVTCPRVFGPSIS